MAPAVRLAKIHEVIGSVGLPGRQPYIVSLLTNDSTIPVAAVATPGIAFAAYYAAIREYFEHRVRLSQGYCTLAVSAG